MRLLSILLVLVTLSTPHLALRAEPTPPPLVPDGEIVPNWRELIGQSPKQTFYYALAWSPDGTKIASASNAGTIQLWDSQSGQALNTLQGHTGPVLAVAFAPDGTRIASASSDNTVRIWDAQSGQAINTLHGHTNYAFSVAFAPDGTRIASASNDNTIRIWDAQSGQALNTLQGHTGAVWAVAFAPDGARVASASSDNTVRIWDAQSGQAIDTLHGHTTSALSVAFAPDGARIASTGGDSTVRIWDAQSGQALNTLQGHTGAVWAVAFAPHGTRIASASRDNTVRIWDAQSGQALDTLQGHTSIVWAVAFAPDGSRMASASGDTTVRIWDAQSGQALKTLRGHTSTVWAVAFAPDGSRMASASGDHTIQIWDAQSGHALNTLQGHTNFVLSIAFTRDGTKIASASVDNTIRIWDAQSGQTINTLQGHANWVSAVAFAPDGARLASAGNDSLVRIWDAQSGQAIDTLEGHKDWVRAVAFAPDGTKIASASDDRTVRIWDAQSGQVIDSLEGHTDWVRAVAFAPDGARLASAGDDNTVRIWDAQSRQPLNTLQGHTQGVSAVAFAPDGIRLASGSRDSTVRIWDTQSGQTLNTLQGHTDEVWTVAFAPDATRLASGSWDNTVRIWDADRGAWLRVFATGPRNAWLTCRAIDNRCWRFDDGTFLSEWDHGQNRRIPIVPRDAGGDVRIIVQPQPGTTASTGTWQAPGPMTFVVENAGLHPAYFIRLSQTPGDIPSPGVVLKPIPPIISLAPGEVREVSTTLLPHTATVAPRGTDRATLSIQIETATQAPVILSIPVEVMAPTLEVGNAVLHAGDEPILEVQLANTGGADVNDLLINASLRIPGGAETPSFDQITRPRIRSGENTTVVFSLPGSLGTPTEATLDLAIRTTGLPLFIWDFRDLEIMRPSAVWAWAALVGTVLMLSALFYYQRVWRRPVLVQVSREPTQLFDLEPRQLPLVKWLLTHSRRIDDVVTSAGSHRARLDAAANLVQTPAAVSRLEQFATVLGATATAIRADAPALHRLRLPQDFPLNLDECLAATALDDQPAPHFVDGFKTAIQTAGPQKITLLLLFDPAQREQAHRLLSDTASSVIIPSGAELTRVLLANDPRRAFAQVIASHTPRTMISPYVVGGGVSKASMFFGRAAELSHILNRQPASFFLVGGRQIGKTSLLKEIDRRVKASGTGKAVYLSIGQADFLTSLAARLRAEASLDAVVQALQDQATGDRLLVLLDEADEAVARDAANGFPVLARFRNLKEEAGTAFIFTGFWHLYRHATADYQSPIYNFGEVRRIGGLDDVACRRLAIQPMASLNLSYAEDGLVERIVTASGSRADLISNICHTIVENIDPTARQITTDDVDRAFASDAVSQSIGIMKRLIGDPEAAQIDRIVVYATVERDSFTIDDLWAALAVHDLTIPIDTLRQSLERLELANILHHERRHYTYRVPLHVDDIRAMGPADELLREIATIPGVKPA